MGHGLHALRAATPPGTTERVSVDSDEAQTNAESYDPTISGDGHYVAFFSYADNLVAGDTNDGPDIFVRDRQSGTTERVNVDNAGAQANADSYDPALSADGRYVAFYSFASNLVTNDTNAAGDFFVRDRQSGTTERISVNSAGVEANFDLYEIPLAFFPSISTDGRFVAFRSSASNLVSGDTNASNDIFVRDRQNGTTERVSVDSAGAQADANSGLPSISADGRYVTYVSNAGNLVSGDTNATFDIFVRDRQSGTTERVSVGPSSAQANANSTSPAISADGRYVAFQSYASNLVAGDTNATHDVFVRDRQAGTTERVSVDSAGAQADDYSREPAISDDGRYVAFYSYASNLVTDDTNLAFDTFVRDRQTGTTERVSVDNGGAQANSYSYDPAISANGRYVAFRNYASNLVPEDTNDAADIFVRDRCSDADGDGARDCGGDNCPNDPNFSQENADANFISNHPPYMVDDSTLSNSDALGDACDSDADNDGRLNTDELTANGCSGHVTDPTRLDTDGDRVTDGAECALGSDPMNASSKPAIPVAADDTDRDGLTDALEATIGTNPGLRDTDGDGLQDGWEYKGYGSNPLIADTDSDGVTDACEVASIDADTVVNPGDQALLAAELARGVPAAQKLANFDLNKDGAINPGDQAFQASMIGGSPVKCPNVSPWP